MTKKCIKCGMIKDLNSFYKHPQMKDGCLNKCKDCCIKESIINSKKESVKRYNRNRPNKTERNEKNKLRMKKLKIENYEKYNEIVTKQRKNYRQNHPEKYKATAILNESLRKGEIIKSDFCMFCNKVCNTEAHHQDYSKPLDVIWLCSECHHNLHKNIRTLKRNSI